MSIATPTRPGVPRPRSSPDQLQARVPPRYRIDRALEGGGMSELLLATDTETNATVVLKLAHGVPGAGEAEARFAREVALGQRFGGDGVVPVLDADASRGLIVLPYFAAGSLADRLSAGVLDGRALRRLLERLLSTLGRIHAGGVVHRDIKPSNILFDSAGNAVLADLGVAADQSAERLTVTGALVGTPAYMAPEQLRGQPVDGRADLYALGVTLFEAALGMSPHDDAARHQRERVLSAAVNDTALTHAVLALLADNPDERPANAREALQAMTGGAARRPALRRIAAAVGVIAVASAALFALATRGPDGAEDLARAEAAFARNEWRVTLAALDDAERAGAAAADVLYLRALASWWSSHPVTTVRAHISAALKHTQPPARARLLAGIELFLEDDYAKARELFLDALAADGPSKELRYGLFEATYHVGLVDEAVRGYVEFAAAVPGFTVGAHHVLSHLVMRGDAKQLTWALRHFGVESVPEHYPWVPRVARINGDVAGAVRGLEDALRRWPASQALSRELGMTLLIAGDGERAVAAVDGAQRSGSVSDIAIATGDRALRAELEEEARATVKRENGVELLAWLMEAVVLATKVESTRSALETANQRLDARTRESVGARRLEILAVALVPELGADVVRAHPHPEVAAFRAALQARERGDDATAFAELERAIAASDGTLYTLARALQAQIAERGADPSTHLAACRHITSPTLVGVSFGHALPRCLALSAEAAAALGRSAEARAFAQRLRSVRSRAPADDPLVVRAERVLAALGK